MKNLYRFSLFSAFSGAVLIVAGGLVKSHEAGLSVPDWPLSYGEWMPPMVGKIFWEHGHRMIATFVGFLTLIMTFWTHFSKGASPKLKSFSRVLVWLVILQGVFGGATVLLNLPPMVSIIHGVLGQIFFSALCLFAYDVHCEADPLQLTLSAEGKKRLEKAFRLARVTLFIFLFQLLLGAATRHMRHLHIALTHTAFALVVVTHVILVYLRIAHLEPKDKTLSQTAHFLLAAVMLQVVLGAGSLGFTQLMARMQDPSQAQIVFTTFHQSLGAGLLATIFLLTWMLAKRVKAIR